jgi:hypothetical protein
MTTATKRRQVDAAAWIAQQNGISKEAYVPVKQTNTRSQAIEKNRSTSKLQKFKSTYI